MDSQTGAAMPRYVCHKKVWALKIRSITPTLLEGKPAIQMDFADERYGPKVVSTEKKPDPQPGWYYVVYESGYFSFSPALEFESGYTLESELKLKTQVIP